MLYEREDLLIGDGIYITDDDKLLLVFDQLSDVFTEEREGRIGDDDICFFEELDTLFTAEVPIPFQRMHESSDIRVRWHADIFSLVDEVDRLLGRTDREEIWILILVAGGDEFLESKQMEVQDEVVEEVTHPRVVAVTEDGLAFEVLFVVFELCLYVFELGVELILLGLLRLGELFVCHKRIA